MKIPDYYKQFQNQPAKKEEEAKKPEAKEQPQKPEQKQEPPLSKKPTKVTDKTKLFQGNGFTINQLEEWEDKTIYTLTGPVTDGIQHNVILNIDKKVPFETLEEYADWQIKTLETELKGCTLLKRGETKLTNGTEAYEAIFKWYPTDEIRIYQHQIYVLVEKTAYKFTASFTKKTRKTLGPQVERMMLSLNPFSKQDNNSKTKK
jgi:hypothetical protein